MSTFSRKLPSTCGNLHDSSNTNKHRDKGLFDGWCQFFCATHRTELPISVNPIKPPVTQFNVTRKSLMPGNNQQGSQEQRITKPDRRQALNNDGPAGPLR